MSKQFVIACDKLSVPRRNRISLLLKEKEGWGFWHYLDSVWLVSGVDESVTSKEIYETIKDEIQLGEGLGRLVVFDMSAQSERTHWGRAKKGGWDWLKKYWGSPG